MNTLPEDVKKLITKKAVRDAIEALVDDDAKDEIEVVVDTDDDGDEETVVIERAATR